MMPLIQPSNRPHMARDLLAGVLLILSGCSADLPERLIFSEGSFSSSPVMALTVLVNGQEALVVSPRTIHGSADEAMPRGGGVALWDYPVGSARDRVSVSAEWVEILTNRAYRARAEFALADLNPWGENAVRLTVIFGPNGQMVVGSDPIPTSADNQPKVDVADVCGQRFPEADFDYRTKANEIAGLTEALQFSYPSVENPKCSGDAP